jgi:hypothetical protein
VSAVKPLTYDEARQLTVKIKKVLADGKKLVEEAYTRRADRALGYSSWDAYVAVEFGGQMLRVPREDRPVVVRSLNLTMGLRPIAKALGISLASAQRAAQAASRGVPNETPPAPKPKPLPKPDRYLQQFYQALAKMTDGAIDLVNLCESQRFELYRDELVKEHRENVNMAYEVLSKLLPNFDDPDVIMLDNEDGAGPGLSAGNAKAGRDVD